MFFRCGFFLFFFLFRNSLVFRFSLFVGSVFGNVLLLFFGFSLFDSFRNFFLFGLRNFCLFRFGFSDWLRLYNGLRLGNWFRLSNFFLFRNGFWFDDRFWLDGGLGFRNRFSRWFGFWIRLRDGFGNGLGFFDDRRHHFHPFGVLLLRIFLDVNGFQSLKLHIQFGNFRRSDEFQLVFFQRKSAETLHGDGTVVVQFLPEFFHPAADGEVGIHNAGVFGF